MRSKRLFWLLAVVVFGTTSFLGFSIRTIHPLLFYILEGIVVLEFILFFLLYQTLIKPYESLSAGVKLLQEQDFATRLRPVRNPEANRIIGIFNEMMTRLKEERLLIREKNQFLDLLINASALGLIILDYDEHISDINLSALRLLGIADPAEIEGKRLEECENGMLRRLAHLHPGEPVFLRPDGLKMFRCIRSAFIDRGFNHPFILIGEQTGEMIGMEKKSYENIIRMMSHEVNNSIGAIQATLHVISDLIDSFGIEEKEDLRIAVEASTDRCVSLAKFTGSLASVIKIPPPSPSNVNLNRLASSVGALMLHECKVRNILQTLLLSDTDPTAHIDGIQFEQVLLNLIKNAYESIGRDGEIRIITGESPVSISIEDNGPGLPEAVQQNLFTPFYTSKPHGYGVGLTFIREVLHNHQCTFTFDSESGWTKFKIVFNAEKQ